MALYGKAHTTFKPLSLSRMVFIDTHPFACLLMNACELDCGYRLLKYLIYLTFIYSFAQHITFKQSSDFTK